ncbi:MAG TPA: sigma-70 family RNA polymerase sigma factor [Gaiellaceae bacterium]|nr:sigma-70 family RNA polymerase sigma factor [Gaiellaceae bacterium]
MVAVGSERARLIEAHLPLVRRLALRYAGRGEQTDDLVQVGALALVRAVDRCDPARKELPAYLARCVDGELRHHLRDRSSVVRIPRRSPRASGAVVPIDPEVADASPPLDEALLDRAALARAARRLADRERRIVLLLYVCDRTQAEVAEQLGLSQAHVCRLARGAVEKLRRDLDGRTLSQAKRAATLRADGGGNGEADPVA